MEFLGRDCSLHGLSTSGSSEKWAQILEVAQNDEHAYMMKIQVNRRNQLRYTPLHTAIFSRSVLKSQLSVLKCHFMILFFIAFICTCNWTL